MKNSLLVLTACLLVAHTYAETPQAEIPQDIKNYAIYIQELQDLNKRVQAGELNEPTEEEYLKILTRGNNLTCKAFASFMNNQELLKNDKESVFVLGSQAKNLLLVVATIMMNTQNNEEAHKKAEETIASIFGITNPQELDKTLSELGQNIPKYEQFCLQELHKTFAQKYSQK